MIIEHNLESDLQEYKKNNFVNAIKLNRSLTNTFAEILTYGWDDSYKWKIIKETKKNLLESIGRIRFDCFSEEELSYLGFKKLDEKGLYLIPLWLYHFIEYNQVLTCIDGRTVTVLFDYQHPGEIDENNTNQSQSNYIDSDTRFGCIAYGVYPAK